MTAIMSAFAPPAICGGCKYNILTPFSRALSSEELTMANKYHTLQHQLFLNNSKLSKVTLADGTTQRVVSLTQRKILTQQSCIQCRLYILPPLSHANLAQKNSFSPPQQLTHMESIPLLINHFKTAHPIAEGVDCKQVSTIFDYNEMLLEKQLAVKVGKARSLSTKNGENSIKNGKIDNIEIDSEDNKKIGKDKKMIDSIKLRDNYEKNREEENLRIIKHDEKFSALKLKSKTPISEKQNTNSNPLNNVKTGEDMTKNIRIADSITGGPKSRHKKKLSKENDVVKNDLIETTVTTINTSKYTLQTNKNITTTPISPKNLRTPQIQLLTDYDEVLLENGTYLSEITKYIGNNANVVDINENLQNISLSTQLLDGVEELLKDDLPENLGDHTLISQQQKSQHNNIGFQLNEAHQMTDGPQSDKDNKMIITYVGQNRDNKHEKGPKTIESEAKLLITTTLEAPMTPALKAMPQLQSKNSLLTPAKHIQLLIDVEQISDINDSCDILLEVDENNSYEKNNLNDIDQGKNCSKSHDLNHELHTNGRYSDINNLNEYNINPLSVNNHQNDKTAFKKRLRQNGSTDGDTDVHVDHEVKKTRINNNTQSIDDLANLTSDLPDSHVLVSLYNVSPPQYSQLTQTKDLMLNNDVDTKNHNDDISSDISITTPYSNRMDKKTCHLTDTSTKQAQASSNTSFLPFANGPPIPRHDVVVPSAVLSELHSTHDQLFSQLLQNHSNMVSMLQKQHFEQMNALLQRNLTLQQWYTSIITTQQKQISDMHTQQQKHSEEIAAILRVLVQHRNYDNNSESLGNH